MEYDSVITYWPALCGNRLEDDAFWNSNLSWTTNNPDLTQCFQDSVLVWLPCGYLMIASLLYIPYLHATPKSYSFKNVSPLCVTKLVACCLLFLVPVIDLIIAAQYQDTPLVGMLSSIILAVSFLLSAIIVELEFSRAVTSSGVLIMFWLLQLVFGIVPFRSYIINNTAEEHQYHVVAFYIQYFFYAVLLILHCLKDKWLGPKYKFNGEKKHLLAKDINDQNVDEDLNPKPCPEQSANIISRIIFFWISKLIINGYRRPLIFKDLWALMPGDTSAIIVQHFQDVWEKHVKDTGWQMVKKNHSISDESVNDPASTYKAFTPLAPKHSSKGSEGEDNKHIKQPSIWKPLIAVFGPTFLLGGFFRLCYDTLGFVSPQLLSLLITFVSAGDPYQWHGYLFAVLLFIVSTTRTLFFNQHFNNNFRLGMRVRTATIAIVYRKALVMNSRAKRESTVGQVVNLMSVDAQKLQDVPQYLHMVWASPLVIIVALYFIWQELGAATFAGFAIMILLIPVNVVLAKKSRTLQMQQMRLKDNRIKLMNEVLNGVKVLKLYAWEESFQDRLSKIREQELQTIKQMSFLTAGISMAFFLAPYLVGLASFAAYVLISPDNILDANKAFVSLSLFNLINIPITTLPGTIAFTVQALISIKRLNKFMQNEELDPSNVIQDPNIGEKIKICNASFSWENKNKTILNKINLSVPAGKLVAIIGAVGTGKSSLLSAMLGEMEVLTGKVHMQGSVAYVPQQAWIQNATVKDNILFGSRYLRSKYKKVIGACALTPDLEILPGGDMTEIGEKGINLSGGQKQRVSLARAVYQNAEIYLLDDPLSAVDSHVGKHIFDRVIGPNGMLQGKTRVLVTNGLSYLPQVDSIIALKDGEISEQGSYQQLLQNNGAFSEFLTQYLNEQDEDDDDNKLKDFHDLPECISDMSGTETGSASEFEVGKDGEHHKLKKSSKRIKRSTIEDADTGNSRTENEKLIVEEAVQTGSVKPSVIKDYINFYGLLNFSITIGFYVIFLVAQSFTNIWLAEWSNDPLPINGTQDIALRDLRLGVYGGMGFILTLATLGQAISIALGTVQASRMTHSSMLKTVLRAPMSFFDVTPLGRILNRFGKDVDTVDFNIPITLKIWLATLAGVVITIFIIMYSTPLFIVILVPLAIFYFLVQRFYIATSRQLKRLESVSRSSIYKHFGETVSGTSIIRAYQASDRFVQLSDQLTDENNVAYYPNIVAARWLSTNLEMIGNIIVLSAAVLAVSGSIDAGTAGLSVSYSLQVTLQLTLAVLKSCDLENHIVAIERIQEYTDCPQEAPAIIEHDRIGSDWPQHGQVTFEQYSTRYRPGLDLVLRGVDCSFRPGEKVGIVGRTGAGKSSLTMALFRIIESVSGSIIIDGKRIDEIGLDDLRSKLTIIPQDPVVFSGTIRMNLDPYESKSDDNLWECLELAHLKSYVQSLPQKLDHECTEGGENMSVGQRQLICLARALLRKTCILVLDEATAAVDLETDELIQATIRAEFKDCTVITIAHRLNTIIDYDRIAVLDNGNIFEFASPSELLRNKKSIFYGMVKDAGLL